MNLLYIPMQTTKSDIYSLGLTIFYTFTEGRHVYGEHYDEHRSSIRTGKTPKFQCGKLVYIEYQQKLRFFQQHRDLMFYL